MPIPLERDVILPGDGISLPARLYLPAGPAASLPGVVIGPGGIENGLVDSVSWMATRLVAAGFAVLTTTWRNGSPLHDPSDFALAIDWLQGQPEIDSGRIGLFGMSRGGMSALRAAALDPRIRGVSSFGSPTELFQHVRGVAAYAPMRYKSLVRWLGGEPDEHRAFYEEVQAFTYASRIKQPVLCVHGAFDMHVPVEQSVWMHRELQRHGNLRAELEIIPAMNHYGDVSGKYIFDFDAIAAPVARFFERALQSGTE